jgi:hypothetical protein
MTERIGDSGTSRTQWRRPAGMPLSTLVALQAFLRKTRTTPGDDWPLMATAERAEAMNKKRKQQEARGRQKARERVLTRVLLTDRVRVGGGRVAGGGGR